MKLHDLPPNLLYDPEFDFQSRFFLKSILGKGAFGYVLEVVNKINREIIALKVT